MKNFIQYLIESAQTYEFKIKLANIEPSDELLDRIEHALQAYEVVSITKPKRLPISSKNLDFPNLDNSQVHIMTATLKYPCTDEQIKQSLSSQGRIPIASIFVVSASNPEEIRREEDDEIITPKKKDPILTTELEDITGGQVQVGTHRVESMLKELESRKMEFASTEKTPKAKTSNDSPQNNLSPVNGRKGTK